MMLCINRISRYCVLCRAYLGKQVVKKHAPTRILPRPPSIRMYSKERGFLTTQQDTRIFVSTLLPEERQNLQEALQEFSKAEAISNGTIHDPKTVPPTMKQLRLVVLQSAIPFLGFGFLDNAIMIVAGEYIDFTIGLTFGISTMAAAALGNLVSDLAGIGLTGYVEAFASKLGMKSPGLSSKQMRMRKTVFASNAGRAVGIAVGCLIGMFPLLFMENEANIIKEKLEILEHAEHPDSS